MEIPMAIWRDPLDELIADLERSMPTSAAATFEVLPRVEDHCLLVQCLLSRNPAERMRLAEDPRVKGVQEYYDRMARRTTGGRFSLEDLGRRPGESRSEPED
jgi:hypothetical protein